MYAPSEEIRVQVGELAAGIRAAGEVNANAEDRLEELLGWLERAMDDAAGEGPGEGAAAEEPEDQLAAAEAWASLASAAVARVYAPASPWPGWLAGIGQKIVRRLRSIVAKLRAVVAQAAIDLGAASFSVSVGFPWGISIGLSFPI